MKKLQAGILAGLTVTRKSLGAPTTGIHGFHQDCRRTLLMWSLTSRTKFHSKHDRREIRSCVSVSLKLPSSARFLLSMQGIFTYSALLGPLNDCGKEWVFQWMALFFGFALVSYFASMPISLSFVFHLRLTSSAQRLRTRGISCPVRELAKA